jgi:hypothetical protein
MTEEDATAGSWRGMDKATGADSPTGTGDARVDAAVARLAELTDAPLDEHPVILGDVHDRLREVLGELGSAAPGPGTPGSRGTP